ncbi:hypothetical protein G6L37_06570 [Agrobacterium rubi]|nr:hypothetical protein [Agrobacterium rubi]NTF25027.1 hypothetical protein [Agrobacterium rubi]
MTKIDPTIADTYRKLRSDLDDHVAAVHEKIKTEGRRVIEAAAAAFFEANPTVEAIRWTQYTPYWSDGDATVFQCNPPDLQIFAVKTKDDERFFEGQQDLLRNRAYRERDIAKIEADIEAGKPADDVNGGNRFATQRQRGPRQLSSVKKEIAEIDAKIEKAGGTEAYGKIVADFEAACLIIKQIRKPDFEIIFGDHVQVFITKDGLRVEEYDHD